MNNQGKNPILWESRETRFNIFCILLRSRGYVSNMMLFPLIVPSSKERFHVAGKPGILLRPHDVWAQLSSQGR